MVTAQLGKLFNANLVIGDENGVSVVKRGTIDFGGEGEQAGTSRVQKYRRAKDGVWLVGNLPELSMQGWGGLTSGWPGGADKTGSDIPIAGANLDIERLTGFGQNIDALHIDAARRGDGLAAQLSGSALNGEMVWQPHGYEKGGKLSAHLLNLQWQLDSKQLKAQPDDSSLMTGSKAVEVLRPGDLPAIEFSVDDLKLSDKQIGRFELVGYPEKSDWRMRRLHITNPDGSLLGDGVWIGTPGKEQTQVNLLLDISDAGKILARSGYPNTVKSGSGKLAANLSWAGRPDEFDYATLNGTLKLDTGKGRFVKMEPGIGKLLSILSLQALPKHITLDFNDVFSEGFQFDNINGNAAIKDGVIDTQDFHIDGSSAKVTMKGSVDLIHETQDLRVRVLPTIGDSVSLIGVFAISPAVGIGSLIANKLLGNPLDKLVSFEYNVSGTWADPNVVKIVRAPAKQNNNFSE